MSIGKKAGKGFLSLLYRGMLEKIMGLAAMVILARKLSPYDFGLVSITEVLVVFISVIGTTGLTEFLLAYRKDDEQEIFKAAFWFNLFISVGILVLFWIALPFWANYQADNRILPIGIITGLIFLSSQLQSLPKALLNRQMKFDLLVKVQAPFIIIIPIAKIAAVYMGWGVYSLIIPTLIFQPILTLWLYKVARMRPGSNFYLERWREIYGFTKHLIGSTILTRIADQGDKFILGKFLGLDKLGVYNIATQMAELVSNQVVMLSNNILSSVLPKYVGDKDKFYSHYMNFTKVFSFFIFPVLAIMFVAAKPVILFLYGAKWEAVITPMRILLVYAALRAVTSSYGSVMNSLHLNKKSFIVIAIYTPIHIVGSIIGSFYGVMGIAISVCLIKAVFINWNIAQMMQALRRPFVAWYKELMPYFLVNVVIATILYLVPVDWSGLSSVYLLIALVVAALCFMLPYYLVFRLALHKEVRGVSVFMGNTFPKMQRYFNLVFGI